MYCHFCGAGMPDDGAFCPACGKAAGAAPLRRPAQTLPVWVGWLLVLGGFLPLLLRAGTQSAQELSQYSVETISAFSLLNQILLAWSTQLQFVASAAVVLLGALILRRAARLRGAVVCCMVTQAVVILRTAVVCLMVYLAPQRVLSLRIDYDSMIRAGERVLQAHLLDATRNVVLAQAVLAAALLTGLCFLLRHGQATGARRLLPGAVLLPVLLVLLGLLRSGLGVTLWQYFGETAYAAYTVSESMFAGRCDTVLAVLLLLALLLAVWLRGWRVYTLLPLLGTLLIFGVACCLLVPQMLSDYAVSSELMALAVVNLRLRIPGAMLLLSAACLWLGAVAGNRLPLAVQIVLPLACLLLYPLAQLLCMVAFHSPSLPLGALVVALTLGIPALCIHASAPEERT